MIDVGRRGAMCDLNGAPNRGGYLILGPCELPRTPIPEPCGNPPSDPHFGISQCRCLHFCIEYTSESESIALRPRDLVRLEVDLTCGD
jgi:hypothetical protein